MVRNSFHWGLKGDAWGMRNRGYVGVLLELVVEPAHPVETYARQNGNLPQVGGESKKCLKPPPRNPFYT